MQNERCGRGDCDHVATVVTITHAVPIAVSCPVSILTKCIAGEFCFFRLRQVNQSTNVQHELTVHGFGPPVLVERFMSE
jgi:hypothetical protein